MAAEYGSMTFVGRSGKTYNVDIYVSDTDAGLVNFDGGGGASSTSPTYWTPPEPVRLIDFAIVTGTAAATKIQLAQSNRPTGDFLRFSINLTTLSARQPVRIPFAGGQPITAIQRA